MCSGPSERRPMKTRPELLSTMTPTHGRYGKSSKRGIFGAGLVRRLGCNLRWSWLLAPPYPPPQAGEGREGDIEKQTRRHQAAGLCLSCVQDQFGSVADFGFGGNAAWVLVPRRRSSAIWSALSSLASGGM